MSRLPSLTPREIVAVLKKAGFKERRQRGSHLVLWHPEREVVATVPMHKHELPRGTLLVIIKQAGLSEDILREFL